MKVELVLTDKSKISVDEIKNGSKAVAENVSEIWVNGWPLLTDEYAPKTEYSPSKLGN